jgi:hypothetical protein
MRKPSASMPAVVTGSARSRIGAARALDLTGPSMRVQVEDRRIGAALRLHEGIAEAAEQRVRVSGVAQTGRRRGG